VSEAAPANSEARSGMQNERAPLPDDAAHILVVDDDRRIRELLKRYLGDNGFRVTVAGTAEEARARLAGLAFDLLVLDVMMPGETGLELTAALRGKSDVPILLLTARAETEHRIEGLEHGADDYLPKPFEPRELLLRINTILRRTRKDEVAAAEIFFGDCQFDTKSGRLWRGEKPVHLTEREAQLMQLFIDRIGDTLTRDDLRDGENGGSERAIDVQINRLRRKIEHDPRNPLYLQTVRGIGYVFKPD